MTTKSPLEVVERDDLRPVFSHLRQVQALAELISGDYDNAESGDEDEDKLTWLLLILVIIRGWR